MHAVLVVEPGIDPDDVVRAANAQLADHQKIRRALVWPEPELPRTEGTRKLKRAAIREWVQSGARRRRFDAGSDALAALVAKYAGRARLSPGTTIDELGLSSLERVELMVALEDAFQTRIDEGAFADARDVAELRTLVEQSAAGEAAARRAGGLPGVEPIVAGARDPPRQPADLDSAARAAVRVDSRRGARAPRADRRAGDLRREPSEPHGRAGDPGGAAAAAAVPARAGDGEGVLQGALFSRASTDAGRGSPTASTTTSPRCSSTRFPLPQREAGARQTLRYIGEVLEDGFSVLIFPEGRRTDDGRDRPVPARHRHDCLAARRAGRAGAARGARQSAAPHVADGAAGPTCAWRSARRCGSSATTTQCARRQVEDAVRAL